MASYTIGQQPAARSTRVGFLIGEDTYTLYPARLDWSLERKAVPVRCAWRRTGDNSIDATAFITGLRLRLRVEVLDAPYAANLIVGLSADDVTVYYDGTPLVEVDRAIISEVACSGRARETVRTTIEFIVDT